MRVLSATCNPRYGRNFGFLASDPATKGRDDDDDDEITNDTLLLLRS